MTEIKRNDRQYIEVEEFEDYELTQCIAYEMAFRNPENIEAIEYLTDDYIRNKEKIQFYYNEQKKRKTNPITRRLIGPINLATISPLLHSCFMMLDIIDFDCPNIFMDKRFNNDFLELLSLEQTRKRYISLDKYLQINTNEYEINVENTIERNGYSILSKLTAFHDSDDLTFNTSDISPSAVNETQVIIKENFKRPKINVKSFHSLDTTLNVNLNRPIKEILAYVKYVKEDLEKNKLMKSPIELIGIELNKADNLVCDDEGEKCFDPRSILSKQEKMADMFFVYDCLKDGYSQRKIQHEIYNYYSGKGIETKTMDSNTLRKYRDIAYEYIEKGRYRELLTGIKETDLLKGKETYEEGIE